MDHKKIAQALYTAEKERAPVAPPTGTNPGMTIDDAYAIQLAGVAKRLEDGEKLIGMKIGITSKGMQNLLGVSEPDYGHLTDKMLLMQGEICPMSHLIQPKVEGELAFCLRRELRGPGITAFDVYNATEWVAPSLEVVDSRIADWKIQLADTVADNASSARIVLGGRFTPVGDVDMRLTGMTLEKNGILCSSGTAAEVMGSPVNAVAWLANKLAHFDIALPAGGIVLAGAFTAAVPALAGDAFTVSFANMGSLTLRFE